MCTLSIKSVLLFTDRMLLTKEQDKIILSELKKIYFSLQRTRAYVMWGFFFSIYFFISLHNSNQFQDNWFKVYE